MALLSEHALLYALPTLRLAPKQLVMGHLVEQESSDLPVYFLQGNNTEKNVEN